MKCIPSRIASSVLRFVKCLLVKGSEHIFSLFFIMKRISGHLKSKCHVSCVGVCISFSLPKVTVASFASHAVLHERWCAYQRPDLTCDLVGSFAQLHASSSQHLSFPPGCFCFFVTFRIISAGARERQKCFFSVNCQTSSDNNEEVAQKK